MIDMTMELMNRPPLAKEAIYGWWNVLNSFEIEQVRSALDKWVDTETKPPTPAQIKELCKPEKPVYTALARPASRREKQSEMAANVMKFVKDNIRKKDIDWIAHWENILSNQSQYKQVTIEAAHRALKNLGKPWKGKQ